MISKINKGSYFDGTHQRLPFNALFDFKCCYIILIRFYIHFVKTCIKMYSNQNDRGEIIKERIKED